MFSQSLPDVISVSTLNELIAATLEDNFVRVAVRGEISNFTAARSGHWYFTLKDDNSQVRCAMFRSHNRRIAFTPENGIQVICTAAVQVYRPRGDLQLVCEWLEAEGRGNLQLAFEQLKQQLDKQGLFDQRHKQPLPEHPQIIGVVTSAAGAAIHDIINVLNRRASGIRIILRPVLVQGEQAAAEIAAAIAEFNRHARADVLIVGRGGGSLEDLQAFNSAEVAHAIFASTIPVISAVGHETDVTIADFVADLRAPTPSAAAELVVKNRRDLEQYLDQLTQRLHRRMHAIITAAANRVEYLARRLRTPQQLLQFERQRLENSYRRLHHAMAVNLTGAQQQLRRLEGKLEALSPLHTLQRGFAVVTRSGTPPQLITASTQLQPDDKITIRFYHGSAKAIIEQAD